MADAERWARCNFDGRPIHPDDAELMATFREWLALSEEERRAPEWREFTGIGTARETTEENDGQ